MQQCRHKSLCCVKLQRPTQVTSHLWTSSCKFPFLSHFCGSRFWPNCSLRFYFTSSLGCQLNNLERLLSHSDFQWFSLKEDRQMRPGQVSCLMSPAPVFFALLRNLVEKTKQQSPAEKCSTRIDVTLPVFEDSPFGHSGQRSKQTSEEQWWLQYSVVSLRRKYATKNTAETMQWSAFLHSIIVPLSENFYCFWLLQLFCVFINLEYSVDQHANLSCSCEWHPHERIHQKIVLQREIVQLGGRQVFAQNLELSSSPNFECLPKKWKKCSQFKCLINFLDQKLVKERVNLIDVQV